MKIKLTPKTRRRMTDTAYWDKAEPFACNPRGILIHRVREVGTIMRDSKESHHFVHYWCGNQTCFGLGEVNDVLLAAPPKGRLVCVYCEARVAAHGKPSADKIVGKHVHKGRCVAIRTCCEHLN